MTSKTFEGSYRHTQPGTLIRAVILGLAVFFAGLGIVWLRLFLFFVVPVLFIIAWLFHSLTIEIDKGELSWRFGPGLVRKSVPLEEIISAEPVRTNLLEGWGIHLSRYGWLYNVSGFDAVAVTLRNGKCFALGTDEPQALATRLTNCQGSTSLPAGIKS
jgi:hypothetical protein